MNKNNFLLLTIFSLSFTNLITASQTPKPSPSPKPGLSISLPMASAGAALKTSHSLDIDYEKMGELLGKLKLNVSPEVIEALKKITDPKAMGETIAQLKLVDLDYKAFQEVVERFKQVIERFKPIPEQFQFRINLGDLHRVPVDIELKLSAENGRNIAGTIGASSSISSMLIYGAGLANCAILAGSCVALYPDKANHLGKAVLKQIHECYTNPERRIQCNQAKAWCATQCQPVCNCFKKCYKKSVKPAQQAQQHKPDLPDAKRD